MKCVKRGRHILKVSDEEAARLVNNPRGRNPNIMEQKWFYMRKENYKTLKRDEADPNIVSVAKGNFGKVLDTNGRQLNDPSWANLKTGEARHEIKEKETGEPMIVDGEILTHIVQHPAPLKFVEVER